MSAIINAAKAFLDSGNLRYETIEDREILVHFQYEGRVYRAIVSEDCDNAAVRGYLRIDGLGNVPEAHIGSMSRIIAVFNRKGPGKPILDENLELSVVIDLIAPEDHFDVAAFKRCFQEMLVRAGNLERLRDAVVLCGKTPDEVLPVGGLKEEANATSQLDDEINEIIERTSKRRLDERTRKAEGDTAS